MNALNRQATAISSALCKDAFGNLYSGQEARALGYLREAVCLLDALKLHANSNGDIRAEKALKEALMRAVEAVDKIEPPFNRELVEAAVLKWNALGISGEGVLPTV